MPRIQGYVLGSPTGAIQDVTVTSSGTKHFLDVTDSSGFLNVSDVITASGVELSGAAFSSTSSIGGNYIFDNVTMNFSTAESKTIRVSDSHGTILWGGSVDTTSANLGYNTTKQHFNLFFGESFPSGTNIVLDVTATVSGCLLDAFVRVR